MLRPGDAAPDFVLKDADGQDVRLSTIGGPIVLYFYPRDNTPGCTMQAKGFRDHAADFARHGATVVGVSMDEPDSHCSFRDKLELRFPLLSDPDGRVHDLYQAWRTSLFGRIPMAVRRCAFVIDHDGIIRSVHPNVNVLRHAKQALGDLERMAAQKNWGLEVPAGKGRFRRKKDEP